MASFVAAWDGPLHILVNNAGVMALPEMRTPEGWEMQFATNPSATSRWPWDCTARSPQRAELASCRSAPAPI